MEKIKLHLQIRNSKETITYSWIKEPKKVYIDGEFVTTICVGEKKVVEINKSSKEIVIEDVNVLENKIIQELNIKEDTTDMYIYCGYLGIKAISLDIYSMNQYNDNILNKDGEKNVRLNVHRVYDKLQENESFKVIIDDNQEYIGNINTDVILNISSGKHKIFYETDSTIEYSIVDIPDNCDNYQIVISNVALKINVVNSYPVNSNTNPKTINCIITRNKKLRGCLSSLQVVIDEDINFNIKNGETKEIKISTGNHIVSAGSVGGMKIVNFNVPEYCTTVYIDIEVSKDSDKYTNILVRTV